MVDHARELHLARVGVDAPADAVDDRARLLVDLLEHEVGIAALFELRDRELELLDVDAALVVVERHDLEGLVAVDDGDLSVVDVDEILRVFDDRRGVRREEILALADADNHRAALTCGDDLVAVALLDDGDGIGADHLLEGLLHGFEQRAAVRRADIFDQVDQHLRVGAAAERVAVGRQGILQHAEVLDDAVVDQGDVLRFGVVGVCIGIVRHAVRGPARVGDADRAVEVLAREEMLQVGDLALALVDVQRAVTVHQGDAGAVVSPVFEAVKPLDQNGASLPLTHVSYYSTHFFAILTAKIRKKFRNYIKVRAEIAFRPVKKSLQPVYLAV